MLFSACSLLSVVVCCGLFFLSFLKRLPAVCCLTFAPCWLWCVGCGLVVLSCSLVFGCWSLSVVRPALCVVRCALFVVLSIRCFPQVVVSLIVACGVLFVIC